MIYCLIYYRGLGIVVVASLLVAGAATYAMVLLLSETANFTLTLPGIAGLIVGGRHHRRLVHRLLRTHPGRDARRQVDAGRGRGRLDPGPGHLSGRRRGLAARRDRALHLRGRRGAGLRVRAGPLHADRPRGVLLVHQAAGLGAGPVHVLQRRRQALRAQRGDSGHGQIAADRPRVAPPPAPAPREAGPDGQVQPARQRASTTVRGRSTSSVASGSGTPSRA